MAQKTMPPRRRPPNRRLGWAIIALIVLIVIAFSGWLAWQSTHRKPSGPMFTKEGALQFVETPGGKVLQEIDIEIADDDMSRERGLMWRKSMEERQGMLFIMDEEDMLAFWMLNTYIALDLVFVNSDKEIVTIRKNAIPQQLDRIPSSRPALYVVEVVAGFCDKYGIREGHYIAFN
ncbi:MAG: DUF192 domain-containing protein [Saprospiraceae bacterium]|jgi:uncharacterized membrane protein (UPF0127 family)|nr:DUF192 domain-containing protein [Saprospiraceae bacterium]